MLCRCIVLLTRFSISGTSDIVNASSISVFKHKLESVDFTPFVQVEFTSASVTFCLSAPCTSTLTYLLCVIFFCWVCINVVRDLCVQTFVMDLYLMMHYRYNQLTSIPTTLGNCVHMDEFNVEGNDITQLPVS